MTRYGHGGILPVDASRHILSRRSARSNGLYSVQRDRSSCPRPAVTSRSTSIDAIGKDAYQGQRVSCEWQSKQARRSADMTGAGTGLRTFKTAGESSRSIGCERERATDAIAIITSAAINVLRSCMSIRSLRSYQLSARDAARICGGMDVHVEARGVRQDRSRLVGRDRHVLLGERAAAVREGDF